MVIILLLSSKGDVKMKIKKLFAIISTIAAVLALCLSVNGTQSGIYRRNVSAISERVALLEAMMDENSSQDTTANKSVAIKINSVIVEYVARINALRADERLGTEDLVPEIDRLYLHGRISGACASVYERGKLLIGEEAQRKLFDVYEESLERLAGISDVTALYKAEAELLGRLNLTLYRERVMLLLESGDTEEAREIAMAAISELERIASGELGGVSYEEVYVTAKKDIEVVRKRIWAEDELSKACESIGVLEYLSIDDRSKLIREGEEILSAFASELRALNEKDWEGLCSRYSLALSSLLKKAEELSLERVKKEYLGNIENGYVELDKRIGELVYTKTERIRELSGRLSEALETAERDIRTSVDALAVESVYKSFLDSLSAIREEINNAELTEAFETLSSRARERTEGAAESISVLSYIAEARRSDILYGLQTSLAKSVEAMRGMEKVGEIEAEYERLLEIISKSLDEAKGLSVDGATSHALSELEALFKSFDEDEEDKESYAKIVEIYEKIKEDILSSSDVESIEKLIDDAKAEITGVILNGDRSEKDEPRQSIKAGRILFGVITALSVLTVLETVAALYIFMWRRGRVTLPQLALAPLIIACGWLFVIILALIDATLGVYIYFGVRDMIAAYKQKREVYYPEREEEIPLLAEKEEGIPCLSPSSKTALLKTRLESVSVEEADRIIDDESAERMILRSDEELQAVRGRKKGFVNVDTISEHFCSGETVSINELKQKGLIAQNVSHVKILARGRIDKPLCVKAQGFSASAVKMIALTGGTAVLVERR